MHVASLHAGLGPLSELLPSNAYGSLGQADRAYRNVKCAALQVAQAIDPGHRKDDVGRLRAEAAGYCGCQNMHAIDAPRDLVNMPAVLQHPQQDSQRQALAVLRLRS